ncbi:hypothetical protein [Duganella sp. Root1480D1]|uniref:hypothetical protein n=1 Tax=Duganella sp. Root1480D1 TaxID=1736471 RepID=UPI00070E0CCA|nr:hypothetical protein [Duganella sp. Root1480D1]KQZ44286.1 hypothetical protein ASD58_18975 [Duganella sp. Root1480D1]
MTALRLAIALCSISLTSCALFAPNDLRLKSVEVAYLGRANFNPEEADEVNSGSAEGQNAIEVLKVSFYSSKNLFELRRTMGFNIGAQAASCQPIRGKSLEIPVGYVYWKGRSVNLKREGLVELAGTQDVTYSVYMPVGREASIAARVREPEFDLQREPFDMCLAVHGGNMLGMGFTSNVLQIPQDQISSAFRKKLPGGKDRRFNGYFSVGTAIASPPAREQ